jgi:hypothetical protein
MLFWIKISAFQILADVISLKFQALLLECVLPIPAQQPL